MSVAIGGTKPGNNDSQRLRLRPLSATRTVASTNTPPFALVEVRTNGVSLMGPSTNAIVSECVLRRGTSEARILPRRFAGARRFAPGVCETAGEDCLAKQKESAKQDSERYSHYA